ncbi:MAG: ABC transporter ATP-binding protein [Tissierellia bacterium]|nr:ABC transporter ATP-binding protein [Tissierellia bacterium]
MDDVIIKISNLKKSFGEKEILKGIDLEVRKGELIGYIGPNGAGKSTTVKLLLGLLSDYEGKIEFYGKDIKDDISYRQKIGYVPEASSLYEELTPIEYLNFIASLYGIDSEETELKSKGILSLLGIEEERFNYRLSTYSKGMKQKVLFTASLIHNPDILFLDEPLNGMDANSVSIVKEVMSEFVMRGKIIFYSSHILEIVEKISSRIVIIDNGVIAANAPFDELKSDLHDSTLESLFNEITGFTNHSEIANEIVNVVTDAKGESNGK